MPLMCQQYMDKFFGNYLIRYVTYASAGSRRFDICVYFQTNRSSDFLLKTYYPVCKAPDNIVGTGRRNRIYVEYDQDSEYSRRMLFPHSGPAWSVRFGFELPKGLMGLAINEIIYHDSVPATVENSLIPITHGVSFNHDPQEPYAEIPTASNVNESFIKAARLYLDKEGNPIRCLLAYASKHEEILWTEAEGDLFDHWSDVLEHVVSYDRTLK